MSERAAREKEGPLRLEPYKRTQTTLAKLVERHVATKKRNPDEFVDVVLTFERVHVLTIAENYSAMRAKGNYRKAGIKLVAWRSLSENRRKVWWRNLLRGKVANAGRFAPRGAKVAKRRKGSELRADAPVQGAADCAGKRREVFGEQIQGIARSGVGSDGAARRFDGGGGTGGGGLFALRAVLACHSRW